MIFAVLVIVAALFNYFHYDLRGMRQKRENYLRNKVRDEVHIGVIWPHGEEPSSYINGLKIAMDVLEKDKRLPYHFRLHFEDEDCGKRAAWRFARDKRIAAVVGCYNSGTVKTCAPILGEAGILFLHSGNNPLLMKRKIKLLIELSYSDIFHTENIKKIAKYAGMKKIALLYKDSEYCRGMKSLFSYQIHKEPDMIFTCIHSYDERSRAEPVYDNIAHTDFDGIVFFGYEKEAHDFLKYLRWCRYNKPFIGNETLDSPDFYRAFPADGLNGVYCSSYTSQFNGTPELQAFSKQYRKKFNSQPDCLAIFGYSAIMLLKKSIEHSRCISPPLMYQSILYCDFSILGMKFEYTKDGILKQNLTACKKWIPNKGFVQFIPNVKLEAQDDLENELFE